MHNKAFALLFMGWKQGIQLKSQHSMTSARDNVQLEHGRSAISVPPCTV